MKKDREAHEDREPHDDDDVILLEDLAPLKDVKGGAGKLLFGEEVMGEDVVDDVGGDAGESTKPASTGQRRSQSAVFRGGAMPEERAERVGKDKDETGEVPKERRDNQLRDLPEKPVRPEHEGT